MSNHDLRQDWRFGVEVFEGHLLDRDAASNYGNWQYVSGVGADARQGRAFNMLRHARQYDALAAYVRAWIPALRSPLLEPELAHAPWKAERGVLQRAFEDARRRVGGGGGGGGLSGSDGFAVVVGGPVALHLTLARRFVRAAGCLAAVGRHPEFSRRLAACALR
ncbi:hypothetical protein HK405_005029 [Cladochytrium tenue]|nr:hypothetical protein HK405_005029 [Cladochytrium tenue]